MLEQNNPPITPVKDKGLYYGDETCIRWVLFYHNQKSDDAKAGVMFDVEGCYAYIGEFTLQCSKWGNWEKCGMNGHYVDFRNADHLCELCDEDNMKKSTGFYVLEENSMPIHEFIVIGIGKIGRDFINQLQEYHLSSISYLAIDFSTDLNPERDYATEYAELYRESRTYSRSPD